MPVALGAANVSAPVCVVTLVAEVEVSHSPVPGPRDAFTSGPRGAHFRCLQLRQQVLTARAAGRSSGHGSGWVGGVFTGLEPIVENRTGEVVVLRCMGP